MTHSAETLFFDIKRRHGLLFVELRTRDNNRLLTPEEALQVADLPEGFTLEPNPETPGKNAFSSKVHKGPMMTKVMQDAGFRYNAEDVVKFDARVIEHAKLAEQKKAMAAMKQLVKALQGGDDSAKDKIKEQVEAHNPGQKVENIDIRDDGMVMVSLSNPQPEPRAPEDLEAFADKEKVRFKVGARREADFDVVRVAIETFEENSWHNAIEGEFSDLPDFLSVGPSRLFESSLTEAETIERLSALGWAEEPRVFLWYRPEQLHFGVYQREDEDPEIFLAPIEDRCDFDYKYPPFEDNLRGDCLEVHPDFMGTDIMENTFPLTGGIGMNEARMRMMALGFVHNPKIESEMSS